MAWNDILAGVFSGIRGDPYGPLRMQLAKQALQMQMDKAAQEKEKNDLLNQQLKIHMRMLEHQEKYKGMPVSDFTKPETKTIFTPSEQGGPQEGEAPTGQVNTGKLLWNMPQAATVGDVEELAKTKDFFTKTGIIKPDQPEGFTGTLKPGEVAFREGSKVAENPKEATPKNPLFEFITDTGNKVYIDQDSGKRIVASNNGWMQYDQDIFGKQPESKGYDTPEQALAEAKTMLGKAGPDAGLVATYDLGPNNKYVPKLLPNITVRIPPFMPAPGMPGIGFNRKTNKYVDSANQAELSRPQVIERYGEGAALAADKAALGQIEKVYRTSEVARGAAENHAKTISELANKKNDTGIPAIDRWFRAGKKAIAGDPDVTNLDLAIHHYDTELARYLSTMTMGGQLSEREAERYRELITGAMKPEQIRGALATVSELMGGKKQAFEDQRKQLRSNFGIEETPAPAPQPNTPTKTGDKGKTIWGKKPLSEFVKTIDLTTIPHLGEYLKANGYTKREIEDYAGGK